MHSKTTVMAPALTPRTSNEPAAILAAWAAIEALSPATYGEPHDLVYGDRSKVVSLDTGPLPWMTGTAFRPGFQLYYRVILGSMLMDQATEALIKVFGDDEALSRPAKKKAAAAELLLNSKGILLAENAVSVSSFPWAVPLALEHKFGELGSWASMEGKLQSGLSAIVSRTDDDGTRIPLDKPTLNRAYCWLLEQCEVPEGMIERPTFVLRHYQRSTSKTQPEALILNSFFLHDLARVASHIESKTAPKSVLQYLGATEKPASLDLLRDLSLLEQAVSPMLIPAAKWPSGEGKPLVMLQQAAVNLTRMELGGKKGLLAVNGPPGTGKTTLLRDVVAMCILDRATAMSAFDEPEKAFTKTRERVDAGNAFFDIYALDPTLRGHEVLVASSNNKAVENISKELPARGAVRYSAGELNYFKSISDVIHGPRKRHESEEEDEGPVPEPVDTWGMIAAVLGNKGNRSAFWNAFWWDEDRGFKTYLKVAKGDSVMIEALNPTTGVIERRTPDVVLRERPPSPQLAKANWPEIRARFLSLKQEIEAEFQALEAVRKLCLRLAEPKRQLRRKEAELTKFQIELDEMTARGVYLRSDRDKLFNRHRKAAAAWIQHKKLRPGIIARILRTDNAKAWAVEDAVWREPVKILAEQLELVERTLRESERARSLANAKYRVFAGRVDTEREQVADLSRVLDAHGSKINDRLVDEDKFAEGHEEWNMTTPWVTEGLNRKREELFVTALALHRAFIDATASKMFHNLGALQAPGLLNMQKNDERRKLVGELWSTLFLVVPVLSTTFASVERMLSDVPPETIGWLLIDEAGQATPQAAAGAILRAKRIVVVGDPLQIQPVVSLPKRLNAGICDFFKLDQAEWTAPEASAQTLSDRVSHYQASFKSDAGERRVGLPLLVHRRCQDPMFSISNKIAYADQMVQAVTKKQGDAVLGASTWFDVDGEPESKWCPAEGRIVIDLLVRLTAVISNPDVFVIAPFRDVAYEMCRLIESQPALLRKLNSDGARWLKDRVGTIHTFQGREAETVILVLGAPAKTHCSAREWAAGTPNILNVAVSRAKHNIYVVGSYSAWSIVGHASHVSKSLPRIKAS